MYRFRPVSSRVVPFPFRTVTLRYVYPVLYRYPSVPYIENFRTVSQPFRAVRGYFYVPYPTVLYRIVIPSGSLPCCTVPLSSFTVTLPYRYSHPSVPLPPPFRTVTVTVTATIPHHYRYPAAPLPLPCRSHCLRRSLDHERFFWLSLLA